jgi:mannose-6-phosphate isomerase-like protein (cupin superfamily)
MQSIRRIVTAHDVRGRSVVLIDDAVNPAPEVSTDICLWATDHTPAHNVGHADAAQRPLKLEPPINGSVFRFVEFPPDSVFAGMPAAQVDDILAGLFAKLGATHARTDTTRSPGMHKTNTVDYVVLLSGEITMLVDDGEVTLKPFDVVVQRGTSHAWSNRGTAPALLAIAMIDAVPV